MGPFDLGVIGAGPGGYVAAIRAAQLGLRVLLVEERATLGGTCLNVGCIPSKALLESSGHYRDVVQGFQKHGIQVGQVGLDLKKMMERKEGVVKELTDGIRLLMKKNKIEVLRGRGEVLAANRIAVQQESGMTEIECGSILLAMGSRAVEIPSLPFDGRRIVSSTEALAFDRVPEHLVVVGAGAVGLELGSVWNRLGARVTVVEMLPQIVPFADPMVAKMLQKALTGQGMGIRVKTRVTGADPAGDGLTVTLEDEKGKAESIGCDKLLVSVGRRPETGQTGLERVGVKRDETGRIAVDARFQTSVPGIYAIGDLVRGPMLAHKAQEEGVAVAEGIAGHPVLVSHEAIPSVVYTHPELAQVGMTEEEAKAAGIPHKVGRYYLKANGRAKCMAEEDGMVKIVAHGETDRLLGMHILGASASEMIGEAVVAMEFQASAEDLARSIHAHPTLSEVIKEACLAVDKRAIHG